MNDDEYELKELIQLSEEFVNYATNLQEKGEINRHQYELLTQTKIKFLNWVEKNKKIPLQNL